MIYDKAEWHYSGDFPNNIPRENGATHIGMYICWAIETNLISDFHLDNSKENLNKIKNREITGRQFLIESCDEVLTDEDFSNLGNKFSKFYYADDEYKYYVDDYAEIFNKYKSLYKVEDNWDNYEKLKTVLDEKYQKWVMVQNS